MMDFRWFRNGLIGSNNFSKIIADDFPSWHYVTHLNSADQQTAKTSSFIEVLTLANIQLIKYIRPSFYHTAFAFDLIFC